MGMPVEKRRYTVSEYLSFERTAHERHEYRNGMIIAMAGGSFNHSLVLSNLIGELHAALKGKPCKVLESNLRVRIQGTPLYTYPDATIICGKRQLDPHDEQGETVTNPRAIFEVLSPSTEAYDRGEKFSQYQKIDTVREYILISQDQPRIEIYERQTEGLWLFRTISGMDAELHLPGMDLRVPLREIFADVEFPAKPAATGDLI